MRFGLLYEGVVVEAFDLPPNRTLADVASDDPENYTPIPAHVDVGFTRTPDGVYVAPTEETDSKVKETA